MAECTGKETQEELGYHPKVQHVMKSVMEAGKVNFIPVAMPYIDSLFMPRAAGDRPDVPPKVAATWPSWANSPKRPPVVFLLLSIL